MTCFDCDAERLAPTVEVGAIWALQRAVGLREPYAVLAMAGRGTQVRGGGNAGELHTMPLLERLRHARSTTLPRVLLAEPDPERVRRYSAHFSYCGFRVEDSATLEETLNKAHTLLPDVIVLDLGADGTEAMRRLKLDIRTEKIPILLLVPAGAEAGRPELCDDFLTTPCSPGALHGMVMRTLSASRKPAV